MNTFINELLGINVTSDIWLALLFSSGVLLLYAFQNFNKPLYSIEPELTEADKIFGQQTQSLKKIKPLHFMMRRDISIKFIFYVVFLCIECGFLIFIVDYAPQLLETNSIASASSELNMAEHIVIATFVVSGLLPNIPQLNKIEELFKRALHSWGKVPINAQNIYANVATSAIKPEALENFIANNKLVFDVNFLNVAADHVNYRFIKIWLKYNFLYQQLKIADEKLIKHETNYGEFSWPIIQAQHDSLHMQATMLNAASSNIIIEQQFFERTKLALKKLYAIIACSPAIQKMKRKEQEKKLTELGFEMGVVEIKGEDYTSRALVHGAVMGLAVLVCSVAMFFNSIYFSSISNTNIDPTTIREGLATSLIWGTFSFAIFTITAWITYTMHKWLVQKGYWIIPSFNYRVTQRKYNLYAMVASANWLIVAVALTVVISLIQGGAISMSIFKNALFISLNPLVLSLLMCFRFDHWKRKVEPIFTPHRIPTALVQGLIMAMISSMVYFLLTLPSINTELILFASSGFVIGFFNSLLMQPQGVDLRASTRYTCPNAPLVDIKNEMGVFIGQANVKDICEDGICLQLTGKYLSKVINFCTQQEVVISYRNTQGNANYNATVIGSNRTDGTMHFKSIKDSRWLKFFQLQHGALPATA